MELCAHFYKKLWIEKLLVYDSMIDYDGKTGHITPVLVAAEFRWRKGLK